MRSQTLGLAALLAASAAHAAPPIQIQRITPASLLPIEQTRSFNQYRLSDNGTVAVWLRNTDRFGLAGVAARFDEQWGWIESPVQLGGEWSHSIPQVDPSGRIVTRGNRETPIEKLAAVFEFTRVDGAWSRRTITIAEDSGVDFAINSIGETSWHFDDAYECTPNPLMIERATGIEVLNDFCSGWPYSSYDFFNLRHLFDDGSQVYRGVDLDVSDHFTSTGSLLFTNDELDSIPTVSLIANNAGQMALRNFQFLAWPAVGSPPGQTPPFTIRTSDSPFAIIGQVALNSNGEILFDATTDTGEIGVFRGPDPVTDAVLTDADALLGRPITAIRLNSFNTQRRFVMEIDHGDDLPEIYLATLCPADMNRDQLFDNGDISAFVQAYLAGSLRADFTNDGLLDNGDIAEFVSQFLAAVASGCS